MASQLECKNELKVSEDEKTLDKFRDFIFKMNAKPDSETKIFSKAIRVTLEDIEILRTRIIEKLRMHCSDEAACITRITINFSNHTSFDYDTWAKFKQENFERADYVESITIKWDFQVSMPMYELPQHHSLVVKISSGLTFPEFMSLMVSGKIEDVNDISIMDNVVVARVEFINTLLGDELKCSPFVRQYGIIEIYQLKSLTKGGIFMPKGQPNKRYTPEFKIKVVETMHREKLSYRETARQFDIPNSRVTAWERIYLEEGAEGLYVERRGRKSTGRSPKIKKEVEEDLIAEVQRLRAENAYLKKLNALVAERVRQEKKHK